MTDEQTITNITDIEYPSLFKGMQLLPGPYFLRGSLFWSWFKDGNNWNTYQVGGVITKYFADHLITPETGENFRTEWFDCVILANNYKLQFRVWDQISPAYHYWEFRWLDENGNDITNTTFTGMTKGSHTGAQAGNWNIPAMCIKFCLLTYFQTNPSDVESGPLPGTPAVNLRMRFMIGGTVGDTALTLPEGGEIKQCMTYTAYDKVHATIQQDIFTIPDFVALNNYLETHGDRVPSDYPPFVPDGIPNDYDPSTPGGGDGNYSDVSDPIDFPDLPVGGALSCGAIHAFHVTSGKISDIFEKLWNTSLLDLDTWQKLFSSPIECIISLHCLPVTPIDGSPQEIWFGNFRTMISAPLIASQYMTIDCGYIDLLKFFGSAMDFSPYCVAQIYLPFSGIHSLKIEDIQGSRIHVKYNIDVLTGECVINVKCGQSVLYKFTGNCKAQIPISSRDTTALGNAAVGVAGVITSAAKGFAAGGGAGALAGGVAAGLSGALSVALHKESVSRSGDMSGSMGILDSFVPYLIIHRPQQSLAVNYNKFKGYPSNITATLSTLSGYTEVEHIHLEGINGATDTELQEIEKLLKNGVII